MINSIIQRHSMINPLSDTEIQILKSASKLFLKQGFSKTTHRQIAAESGIGLGTITYHYRVKEDMLRVLIEELMDYHLDIIVEAEEKTEDNLFSYVLEVSAQIALCETDSKAYDLYYSAYNHPHTFDYIKEWATKKNYHLLKAILPDMDEEDFRKTENITSGIELAAFTSPTSRYFSLNDKITLFADSMLKIYGVDEDERKAAIEKVVALDYVEIAKEMWSRFANRLDNDVNK